MSNYVWACTADNNYSIHLNIHSDTWEQNHEAASNAAKMSDQGLPVPQEMCPQRIWADLKYAERDRLVSGCPPDLFATGAPHWIMSAKAATVFKRFNLGGGAVYPISDGFYRADNKTRIDGDYFCWIVGNVKKCFVGEVSKNVTPGFKPDMRWKLTSQVNDDDIAVSSEALIGADVWIDRMLWVAIFLSGPLGDALVDCGLRDAFSLRRCRVV